MLLAARDRVTFSNPVFLWTPLALAVVVFAGRVVLHALQLPPPTGWNDSYVYLEAAGRLVSAPGHVYDGAALQLQRAGPQRAYLYLPSGLLPFVPLLAAKGAWGVGAASTIWAGLDAAALFAALLLIGRRCGLGWPLIGLLLIAVGVSNPAQWEIGSGQVNGVVLLVAVLSLQTRSSLATGALLGLAFCIKPVAPLLLLLPLLRRDLRATVVMLATILLLNLPLALVVGWQQFTTYVTQVLPFIGTKVLLSPSNVSLPALLAHGARAVVLPLWAVALVTAGRVLLVAAWVRIALNRAANSDLALYFALAAVPLLGATVWAHYFLYVVPLVFVAMTQRLAVRIAAALFVVAIGTPDTLLLLQPATVVLVATSAVSVLVLRRPHERVQPPTPAMALSG